MEMTPEIREAAQDIAESIIVDDGLVRESFTEFIKSTWLSLESERHPGQMVTLDDQAQLIWDEASRLMFEEWLNNR